MTEEPDPRGKFSCEQVQKLTELLESDTEKYSRMLQMLQHDSPEESKVCIHRNLPSRELFRKLRFVLDEIENVTQCHVVEEAETRENPGRGNKAKDQSDSGIVVSTNSTSLKLPIEETNETSVEGKDSFQSSIFSKSSQTSTLGALDETSPTEEELDNVINELQQETQTSPKELSDGAGPSDSQPVNNSSPEAANTSTENSASARSLQGEETDPLTIRFHRQEESRPSRTSPRSRVSKNEANILD